MKKNKVLNGIVIFFAVIGMIVFLGIPVVLVSNVNGIGSMLSIIGTIRGEALVSPSSGKIVEGAMYGVARSLNDPYTDYYNESEWKELNNSLNSELSGIGIHVTVQKDGKLTIVSPIKGSPGEKAGLKKDDIIISIDNKKTDTMNLDEAVQFMRGNPETKLDISVYRPKDGKEYSFSVIRKKINIPTIETVELTEAPNIGYIKLSQFSPSSVKDMRDGLSKLKDKTEGLILDLRDNPGGNFDVALEIADEFLDAKEVTSTEDSRAKKTEYYAHEGSNKLPMVVLVNGNSASASEVLSGALKDNERALLVGEKTFGKGIIQTIFPLRNGGALKLTTHQYFTPNGSCINKKGIEPNYTVKNSEQDKTDVQLNKAIELLQKRK